jgi:Ni,Fe-hydrogenase III large subunit
MMGFEQSMKIMLRDYTGILTENKDREMKFRFVLEGMNIFTIIGYSGIECRIMCPVGLTWLSVDGASVCQQYTNATERVCLLQSYTHSLTHSLTHCLSFVQ